MMNYAQKAYKITSPVRYFPLYVLIKERKLGIITDMPSDRLADCIDSVPETNPATEKSVSTRARKKYNILATATTILSNNSSLPTAGSKTGKPLTNV
jgi:hypothetical protein